MNEYLVSVDRARDSVHISGNRIHLPYVREGELWADLQRPALYSRTGNISPEAQDLIDFATAVFHLDKLCLRGEREQWVRKITLKIGLRNPERFNAIADDLTWALSVLGADNFVFDISRIPVERAQRRTSARPVRNWGRLTDIALLSGGQDSFAGAARMLTNRANPLFVRVNTSDRSNLSELTASLRQKFQTEPNYYSQTVASLKHPQHKHREVSQRLRSFYFLSIASVLANAHGVSRVHINENGIMAIHLPLDAARSSSFSTRTAYPQFLSLFESIIGRWIGHPIDVRNAFVLNTKAEVLQELASHGMNAAIRRTVSCAHSATIQQTVKRQGSKDYLMSKTAADYHCGYCFPCILRRTSMWKAGLQNDDVRYACDPFKVFVDGSADDYQFVYEASSAILGLIRLITKFDSLDPISLLSEYPQIAESASVLGDSSMNEIIALHRRFSTDMKDYIRANAQYLEFMFDPTRSRQLEATVKTIASDEVLDAALRRAGVQANEAFYKQMGKVFDFLRLRIQVALATGAMNEQQMREFLERSLNRVIGNRRRPIILKNGDGSELKKSIWAALQDQPCPPFW